MLHRLKTLERQLGSADAEERDEAVARLARSKSAYALQLLYETAGSPRHPSREAAERAFAESVERRPRTAIRHRNPALRQRAIELAAESQNVAAVPELSRLLATDRGEETRCLVADVLGQIAHESCVSGLAVAVSDRSLAVRRSVLLALGRITSVRAERTMTSFLTDEDWSIRQQACEILTASGWRPQTTRQRALVAILQDRFDQAIRHGESSAQMLLHTALHADDAQTRQWATIALRRLTGHWAHEELRAQRNSSEPTVRRAAVDALRLLGPSRVWGTPQHASLQSAAQSASVFPAAVHMLALAGEP